MRNIEMFILIFLPLAAILLICYTAIFGAFWHRKKKQDEKDEPAPMPTPMLRDELVRKRAELVARRQDLTDAAEIRQLNQDLLQVNEQLIELATLKPKPAKPATSKS